MLVYRSIFVIALLVSYPIAADTITLKDGNVFQGKIIAEEASQTIVRLVRAYIPRRNIRPRRARNFDKVKTTYLKDGTALRGVEKKLPNGDHIVSGSPTLKAKLPIKRGKIASVTRSDTMQIKLRNGQNGSYEVLALNQNRVVIEDIADSKGKRDLRLTDVAEVKQGRTVLVDNKSEMIRKYRPHASLSVSPILPMGEVGKAVGMGLGAELSGGVKLLGSTFDRKGLLFRTGGSVGFATFSSSSADFDASLTLIPILGFAELSYPMRRRGILIVGLRPFVRLGLGVTMASMSKTFNDSVTGGDTTGNASTSGSSLDGTLRASVGAGYTLPSMPSLELNLKLSYHMAFEQVSGQFLYISGGASYRL